MGAGIGRAGIEEQPVFYPKRGLVVRMTKHDHIGSGEINSQVVIIALEEVTSGDISPFIDHIMEHRAMPMGHGDLNAISFKRGGFWQPHPKEPIPITLYDCDWGDLLQRFDGPPG